MDVHSIPQNQKKNVDAVDFDESNQHQKLSLSNHHDQKKNFDGTVMAVEGGRGRTHSVGLCDGLESNQLQKLSSSNHDDQKKENLCDEYLERRKEQVRKARSKLLLMPGFSPANFCIDDHLFDEEFMQSMKQEQAWRASNTCPNCRSLNWRCWCKPVHLEEMLEARKGPSTPIKRQPKETLLSFLLGRL
ncbi:hypothetical protein CTI12_AA488520 [Artemisia annua]|uniref:Uncharacterized protein n=1 Tax=Artemisia annua TaxID=35608 RepID=A0A2U1LI67_ARTAN|nr:hypothetical protein CTI12_AA488520 [Artemisia annua]